MARAVERLTAKGVERLKVPGYYADGAGLYLQVSPAITKSWIFRYKIAGRAREMGLGSFQTFGLAEARERAKKQRQMLADGVDPIEARDAVNRTAVAAAARAITFDQAAEAFIEAKQGEWKNAKHGDQWRNTLATYASPKMGKLNVSEIDTALVLAVLKPIWATKTETSTRLRGRIEKILDWATPEYRDGPNPARWKGHLQNKLANPEAIAPVESHPALPYVEVGAFMEKLRAVTGTSALAAELIILTAVRTNEALGATWSEFDMDARVWTIPAARMKKGKEHRVPLCDTVMRVLTAAWDLRVADDGFVFPGRVEGRPLSNMSCLMMLERMGRGDLTIHGFRSTFRDWAAEQTAYPRDVCEMALAHAVADKTEAAYRRGDLLEKRALLMADWAAYCSKAIVPAKVVRMEKRAKAK